MSVANQGEAEKCRDLGKKYLVARDYEKAIKFFDKSLRLFELPAVKAMRERAQAEMNGTGPSSSAGSSSSPKASTSGGSASTSPQPQNAAGASSSSKKGGDGSTGRKHTPEQEAGSKELIKLAKTSHYKVLGISKSANDAEIRKAYRKLSLKYVFKQGECCTHETYTGFLSRSGGGFPTSTVAYVLIVCCSPLSRTPSHPPALITHHPPQVPPRQEQRPLGRKCI